MTSLLRPFPVLLCPIEELALLLLRRQVLAFLEQWKPFDWTLEL